MSFPKTRINLSGAELHLLFGGQLRYRGELKAPGGQRVDDGQGGGDGAGGHVVQQNNVSVPNAFQHPGLYHRRVMDGPVFGVHGPLDNGHFQGHGHLGDGFRAAASGGTEQFYSAPFRQQGKGALNFLSDIPAAHGCHGVMGKAVAADFVALLQNSQGQLRVLPDAVAAEEKGGLHMPFPQSVQQCTGKPPGGAVVKGQRHRGRGADGKHQQKAQKQRRENFSHKTHLLRKRLGLTGGGKWGMI